MSRSKIIFIHILSWTLFLAYTYFFWLNETPDRQILWLNLSINIAKISTFYYCYSFIYPRFAINRNKIFLAVGILSACIFFALCRYGWEEVLYPAWLGFRNYDEDVSIGYYIFDNLYYAIPYIVLSAAIFFLHRHFVLERMNLRLKEEAGQAELAFLRSQINPHFLYNSLNYMYSLALPKSQQLADALVSLADLMRYTLKEHKDGLVFVEDEITYIQNYISLFSIRFSPQFYISYKVDTKGNNPKIAPLILIAFVENALKHGVVNQPEHPISIDLSIRDNELEFTVSNRKSNKRKEVSGGIGLVNVQKRLSLLYPGRHRLDIRQNQKEFCILLQITL